MKENWQYKKLGEVCEIYQPKTISIDMMTDDGEYYVYGANGIIGKYTNFNHAQSEVLMTCRGATCGTINVSLPFSWINGNAMVIHPKNTDIFNSQEFLVYALKSIDLSNVITGCAQPQITRQSLSPVKILVPPLSEQERIVTELDLLSGIIEKQKQQLNELDTLSQSIFYSMFGDPITNEKGWRKEKLGKDNEISSAKRVLVQDVVDVGIPFIRGTELAVLSKQNIFDLNIFSMFITKEHYEKVKAITGVPKINDLLIPSINPDGLIWEVNTSSPFYFKDGRVIWVHVNKDIFSSKWLRYALSKIISEKYNNLSRGAVFTELTLVFIRNIGIPIPPLSLQNEFAEKIEKIEKQKTAINKSIEETQKLFDYTMDKYFG